MNECQLIRTSPAFAAGESGEILQSNFLLFYYDWNRTKTAYRAISGDRSANFKKWQAEIFYIKER